MNESTPAPPPSRRFDAAPPSAATALGRAGRQVSLLVAIVAALPLGACTSAKAPQSRVGELLVVERTEDAVRVDVEVFLRNPGDEPLTLRRAEYDVSVGDARWSGQWSAQASIPRHGERRLLLPAVLPPEAVDDGARWRVSGRVSWLEPGRIAEVFHDAGLRRPKARFSGGGAMPGGDGASAAGPPSPALDD